jgi:hypothetical protein
MEIRADQAIVQLGDKIFHERKVFYDHLERRCVRRCYDWWIAETIGPRFLRALNEMKP